LWLVVHTIFVFLFFLLCYLGFGERVFRLGSLPPFHPLFCWRKGTKKVPSLVFFFICFVGVPSSVSGGERKTRERKKKNKQQRRDHDNLEFNTEAKRVRIPREKKKHHERQTLCVAY